MTQVRHTYKVVVCLLISSCGEEIDLPMGDSNPIRLEDYVVENTPLEIIENPKQKRESQEYFGVEVELAIVANSLGPNCLIVFMHVVKMSNKLKRLRNYVWIDKAFAEQVQLSQRVILSCITKLESTGLIDAAHRKGRFIKVWLLENSSGE
jgi:GTP-sensing pleiotropic transcriptional regulator CodY